MRIEDIDIINKTNIDVIDMLNNTRSVAKTEYINSYDMIIPENLYGNLDINRIHKNMDLLGTCIGTSEQCKCFEEILSRELLYNNMIKNAFVACNFEYNNAKGNHVEIGKRHRELNERLYGKPDKLVFESILNRKNRIMREHCFDEVNKRKYERLQKLLYPIEMSDEGESLPQWLETMKQFAKLVDDFFEPIIKYIPENKEEFTIEEACTIANIIMKNEYNADKEGWKAVVERGGAIAHVLSNKKRVYFPELRSRGNYTNKELRSILVHEIGTHFYRSLIYGDHPIKFLSEGMLSYEAFEEGIAKAVDQAINHQYSEVGEMHYISIGLIYFGKKNFRDVFEIQKLLEDLGGDEPVGRCFDATQRAFRGTCMLPNNKDLAYYNGFHKVVDFITNHIDDPELFDKLFLSGKTDITQKLHEELVYQVRC